MEKVMCFEGIKEISVITNSSEVHLPEYNDMRRIYLRSKLEVSCALARGKKVFQQRITNDRGEYTVVYIEVPFNKLLDLASAY